MNKRILTGVWLAVTAYSAIPFVGCIPGGQVPLYETDAEASESAAAEPTPTPAELALVVEKSALEAESTARLLKSGTNAQARRLHFRNQIQAGVDAAEQIISHTDATEDQRRNAHNAALALLYHGVQYDSAHHEPAFRTLVERIESDQPDSQQAAVAAAIWLEWKFLRTDAPSDLIMKRLTDYASQYPQSVAGIELFRQHANRLLKSDDSVGAMNCLHAGIEAYAQHPQVQSLRTDLVRIQVVANQQLREQQAKQQKIADVVRRLGSRQDGLFLIYAHENKKTGLFRFEYEVFRMDQAVPYIAGLAENWTWELVRWFPDGDTARRQAYAMRDELTKKKTFTTIPVFE